MSFAEKFLSVIIIVLGVVLVFVYLPGEDRAAYMRMLGNEETQGDGIIGLFLLKEDIIPFLTTELVTGERTIITDVGLVKLLGRKYHGHQDDRIEKAFRRVVSLKPLEVKREIYFVIAESHNKEVIDMFLQGLETEEDMQIKRALLENVGGFGETILEDEEIKDRVRARLLALRGKENEEINQLVESLLGHEVKILVGEAEKAAENFDFAAADKLYAEAAGLSDTNLYLNYSLGRYYLKKKDEPARGKALLEKYGFYYTVAPTDAPPVADGKLDETMWKESLLLKDFWKNTREISVPRAATMRIEVKMRYDKDNLYLAGIGYSNYSKLIAKAKTRDSQVWQDDCCEIYFDVNADQSTYYQIITNFQGTVWDGSCEATPGRRRRRWPRSSWNASFKLGTHLELGEYWSIEYAIPWKTFEMQGPPEPGTLWGFNFAWVKQAKPAQFSQWSPTYGSAHRPWFYGYIEFK